MISVAGNEFKNLYYTSPVRYESESAFKDGFAAFAAKYAAAAVVGDEIIWRPCSSTSLAKTLSPTISTICGKPSSARRDIGWSTLP